MRLQTVTAGAESDDAASMTRCGGKDVAKDARIAYSTFNDVAIYLIMNV